MHEQIGERSASGESFGRCRPRLEPWGWELFGPRGAEAEGRLCGRLALRDAPRRCACPRSRIDEPNLALDMPLGLLSKGWTCRVHTPALGKVGSGLDDASEENILELAKLGTETAVAFDGELERVVRLLV